MNDDEMARAVAEALKVKAAMLHEIKSAEVEAACQPPSLDDQLALYLYDQLARKGATHCRRN